VCDGVGGWANHGIDPGLYSKRLCKLIGDNLKKNPTSYLPNPSELLVDCVKQNK